jgi:hypothetical protein
MIVGLFQSVPSPRARRLKGNNMKAVAWILFILSVGMAGFVVPYFNFRNGIWTIHDLYQMFFSIVFVAVPMVRNTMLNLIEGFLQLFFGRRRVIVDKGRGWD